MKVSEEKYKNTVILIDGGAKSGGVTIVYFLASLLENFVHLSG